MLDGGGAEIRGPVPLLALLIKLWQNRLVDVEHLSSTV